jgi:hypothetical protein
MLLQWQRINAGGADRNTNPRSNDQDNRVLLVMQDTSTQTLMHCIRRNWSHFTR